MSKKDPLEKTKALMRSLLGAPPRPHGEMKLGRTTRKARAKKKKKPAK